jgi:hypothetical protein
MMRARRRRARVCAIAQHGDYNERREAQTCGSWASEKKEERFCEYINVYSRRRVVPMA